MVEQAKIILHSPNMADDLIRHYNLTEHYQTESLHDTREILKDRTTINITKRHSISLTVEDTAPQMAADIANFYVTHLDRQYLTLRSSQIRRRLPFLEKQLQESKKKLAEAVDTLKALYTKATGDTQLQARMYEAATLNLLGLSTAIQPLLLIDAGKKGKGMLSGDRSPPTKFDALEIMFEYHQFMEELKAQEKVYVSSLLQYQKAKLAELKDESIVTLLNSAVPATEKSKPRTLLNVLVAGASALFIGIFLAFFLEYLERIRTNKQSTFPSHVVP